MALKEIKEIYWEDFENMRREGQRYLVITNSKWIKQKKKPIKEMLWDKYWHLVNRALFHMTTATEINWEYYNFKNTYYFSN